MTVQIRHQMSPNPRDPRQVRVFMECLHDMHAEAAHRAMGSHFAVSKLMASVKPNFSHFVYVTASQGDVESRWPDVERDAARATGTTPPNAAPGIRPGVRATADGPPLMPLTQWSRALERNVVTLRQEITRATRQPQPERSVVSLSHAVVSSADAAAVVAELQRQGMTGGTLLRAQIALYGQARDHARVIELCLQQRDIVLGLPLSGKYVELILRAFEVAAADPSIRDRGINLVREMLPELDRIRQGNAVRRLLIELTGRGSTDHGISAPVPDQTLPDVLVSLIGVAPAERTVQLESIRADHPQSPEVLLALAEARESSGDRDGALDAFMAVPMDTAQRLVAQRGIMRLLIAAGRYGDARGEVAEEEVDPYLRGMRGIALYRLGEREKGLDLLESVWLEDERSTEIALPLAQIWRSHGRDADALSAYLLVYDVYPDLLSGDEPAYLLVWADVMGAALTATQSYDLASRYFSSTDAGRDPQLARDVLTKMRESTLPGSTEWRQASADLLENLALANDPETIATLFAGQRQFAAGRQITWEQHAALVEGIEIFIDGLAALRPAIVGEYQAIAQHEIAQSLRANSASPAYLADVRRALHFLDRHAADELQAYEAHERAALAARNMLLPPVEVAASADLSSLRLALVGGHSATRREVERTLREEYGLNAYAEVAPSSEAHIDRERVREQIADADLVAVVTGYTGHDLTGIVRDLDADGLLTGRVLWLPCRGKSGVVREIVRAAQPQRAGA